MPPNPKTWWHVHSDGDPYCVSYETAAQVQAHRDLIRATRNERSEVSGPHEYPASKCPLRKEREARAAHNPTPVPSQAVSLREIICAECGEPMDTHIHPTKGGAPAAAPAGRSSGPRKPPTAHPPCPHCGGRLHWNDGGGKVNFECLFRQQMHDLGRITDPMIDRLPVAGADEFVALGKWIEEKRKAGATLRYGKMEDPGGVASTYSALRPRHKPESSGSAPASSITEVAQSVAVIEAAPVTEPTPESNGEEDTRRKQEERTQRRRELLKQTRRR